MYLSKWQNDILFTDSGVSGHVELRVEETSLTFSSSNSELRVGHLFVFS